MKILPYLFFLLWTITITSCAPQESSSGKNTATQVHQLLQDGKRFEQENKVKLALICYWDALDLLGEERDTVLKANTYNQLGDLLFRYGLYEKAVENHRKGYNLAQRTEDHRLLYETTSRLSLDYTLLNQGDTARYFKELSQQIASKNNLSRLLSESTRLTSSILAEQKDSICSLYEREQLLNWEARYKQQKAQLQAERIRNERLTHLSVDWESSCFCSPCCSSPTAAKSTKNNTGKKKSSGSKVCWTKTGRKSKTTRPNFSTAIHISGNCNGRWKKATLRSKKTACSTKNWRTTCNRNSRCGKRSSLSVTGNSYCFPKTV